MAASVVGRTGSPPWQLTSVYFSSREPKGQLPQSSAALLPRPSQPLGA